MDKKLSDKDISLGSKKAIVNRLEKDIQRDICDHLAAEDFFFWRNNTVPVFHKGEFRSLPKYTPRGLPDVICLYQSIFYGIEVKRPGSPGGTPSTTEAQMAMKAKIIDNGGKYEVVFSLDDFFNKFPDLVRKKL